MKVEIFIDFLYYNTLTVQSYVRCYVRYKKLINDLQNFWAKNVSYSKLWVMHYFIFS